MNRALTQTVVLSLALGCHDTAFESACQWIGACDQADPPAQHVIILCDNSVGSSCSSSTLDSTISVALQHIVERPGSRIELWGLGSDVASTRILTSFTITRSKRNGVRATLAHRDSQIDAAQVLLRQRSDEYSRSRPPSRSPLVSAFAKLSLAVPDSRLLHIIAVSDGLEYGNGWDFECSPPDTTLFRQSMQSAGILTPGSLEGTTVIFAFVTLGEIDGNRCSVEIRRARRIRELWTSILRAAGARHVNFESGPPQVFHDVTEQGERQ